MTDAPEATTPSERSRRTVLKTGAAASVGSLLLSSPALAQEGEDGEGGQQFQQALMFGDEFRSGAVFRVSSPALASPPRVAEGSAINDRTTHVIEYFNTQEEAYLFVPDEAEVQQGELYVLADAAEQVPRDEAGMNVVRVEFRALEQEDFPFDLEEAEGFDLLEGGGEAAVRPRNLSPGGLFRVTSEPQGWVPSDVADSGFFTDYDTRHAEYLGTDDEFLFFPQEDASVEVDQLYVLWDEFEFFTPDGNLVAAEFDPVDEGSIAVDDEFL